MTQAIIATSEITNNPIATETSISKPEGQLLWTSLEAKQIQVYRRENGILKLEMTLFATDTLTSPLLSDFSCLISQIFD